MTQEEFAAIIRAIEGYWPNKTFGEDTLDVWWTQMQAWRAELVHLALVPLARSLQWLPSFSQLAEGYRIEVLKADRPKQTATRHLHVAHDPELRDRWRRVIHTQLAGSMIGLAGRDDRPIARAVRKHYRVDSTGLVVLDATKMLADAEQALAESAFGQED